MSHLLCLLVGHSPGTLAFLRGEGPGGFGYQWAVCAGVDVVVISQGASL